MSERPNILYVFTDQQSASAMSAAGNPDLRTPAMDRLAAEGVRFARAYCSYPLCSPARASMFTGRMPHECGVGRNNQEIDPAIRPQGLGRLLGDAGYDCVYGGKWHVPQIDMPEPNAHGFRRICGFSDLELADACIADLRRRERTPAEERRPFFMVASFDNPHNICEWGRSMRLPWGEIGEPPPAAECPPLPPNFLPAPLEPEILRIEQACNWSLCPYRLRSPEDWRRLRWAYFRLVERVDREIGRIMDALRETGLADNTVVIFSSDHGDGHGAHQWNQKSCHFEEVVRIPFVIRAPGGRAGAVESDRLVSNGLDLLPTVCDYAGVPVPAGLRGASLRPIAEGRFPSAWRDQLPIELFFDGGRGYNTAGRVLLTARHKYVVYDRGQHREQLFDLTLDPHEMANLAEAPEHRPVLSEHRRRLDAWCAETGDWFRGLLATDA